MEIPLTCNFCLATEMLGKVDSDKGSTSSTCGTRNPVLLSHFLYVTFAHISVVFIYLVDSEELIGNGCTHSIIVNVRRMTSQVSDRCSDAGCGTTRGEVEL